MQHLLENTSFRVSSYFVCYCFDSVSCLTVRFSDPVYMWIWLEIRDASDER